MQFFCKNIKYSKKNWENYLQCPLNGKIFIKVCNSFQKLHPLFLSYHFSMLFLEMLLKKLVNNLRRNINDVFSRCIAIQLASHLTHPSINNKLRNDVLLDCRINGITAIKPLTVFVLQLRDAQLKHCDSWIHLRLRKSQVNWIVLNKKLFISIQFQ